MNQISSFADRFSLVLLASRRVKEIESGAILMTPRGKDRDTIVALRELDQDLVDTDEIRDALLADIRSSSPLPESSKNLDEGELAEVGVDETFLASLQEEVQKKD